MSRKSLKGAVSVPAQYKRGAGGRFSRRFSQVRGRACAVYTLHTTGPVLRTGATAQYTMNPYDGRSGVLKGARVRLCGICPRIPVPTAGLRCRYGRMRLRSILRIPAQLKPRMCRECVCAVYTSAYFAGCGGGIRALRRVYPRVPPQGKQY